MRLIPLSFLLGLLAPCYALAMDFAPLSELECKLAMTRDLDFIQGAFEVRYAPAEWKKNHAGWDLNTEIDRAKRAVEALSRPSVKDYQCILKSLFNSPRDFHVGVLFFSTEAAELPFHVAGAGGKFFITAIDRERLRQQAFPFEIGDELVLFDNRPPAEVIQELKNSDCGEGDSLTNQSLAERSLTSRRGMIGHVVPRGPISFAVRSQKTKEVSSYQIIWEYTPERIREPQWRTLAIQAPSEPSNLGKLGNHPLLQRKMIAPLWERQCKQVDAQPHTHEVGERESFIPALAKKTWQTDANDPFHAYVFKHPKLGRSVGYVRIPHYLGDVEEVDAFAEIIAQMQRRTDALIIDQVNNPGGSAFYLYALASLLTDKPLPTPRHRMSLTQANVYHALDLLEYLEQIQSDRDAQEVLGETLGGYPVTYQVAQFMVQYCHFILEEWNAGHRLTSPFYLYGVDHINPHHYTRYTKPILMLINELDFSGGDFLPAILQDSKRVTTMGTRTGGAGGYIDHCTYPNLFGVAVISYTASIAERLDSNPIESLGVTPDIPYVLTEKDLASGYTQYTEAILEAVGNLLQK